MRKARFGVEIVNAALSTFLLLGTSIDLDGGRQSDLGVLLDFLFLFLLDDVCWVVEGAGLGS